MTESPQVQEVPGRELRTAEERKWAAYAHQTMCFMFLVYLWSGALIATTVLMEVFKSRSRFVVFHARQTLYLQFVIIALVGPVWLTSKFYKLAELSRLVQALIVVSAILGLLVCVTAMFCSLIAASRIRAGEDFEYWLVGRWARWDEAETANLSTQSSEHAANETPTHAPKSSA